MDGLKRYLTLAAIAGFLLVSLEAAAEENHAADASEIQKEQGNAIEELVASNTEINASTKEQTASENGAIFKKKKIGIIEGETEEESFDIDKLVAAMSVYSALGYGSPPIGLLSALLIANGWQGSLTEMATLAYTIEGPKELGGRNSAQVNQAEEKNTASVGLAQAQYRTPAAMAAPQLPPSIKFVSTPYLGASAESFTRAI